jgi:hypothetical protein
MKLNIRFMSETRLMLVTLDRLGAYVVYSTVEKQACLYDGIHHLGTLITQGDLLDLFVHGWIARYDSREG